jgi:large subunit ribosomal protein L4e
MRRFHWVQERRQKAKAEKMSKIRLGQKGSTKIRDPNQKTVGKNFCKTMKTESDYIGEDYEVFSSWLGQSQKV